MFHTPSSTRHKSPSRSAATVSHARERALAKNRRRSRALAFEDLEGRRLFSMTEVLGPIQLTADNFQVNGTAYSTTDSVQIAFVPTGGETATNLIEIDGDGTDNTVMFDESSNDPSLAVNGTIGAIVSGANIPLWSGSTSLDVNSLTHGQISLAGGASLGVAGVSFTLGSLGLSNPNGGSTSDAIVQLQGSLSVPDFAGLNIAVGGSTFVDIGQSGVSVPDFSASITGNFQFGGLTVTASSLSASYVSAGNVFSLSGNVGVTAGSSVSAGYVSFDGDFGTNGLVITNGSLTSFDVTVSTDVNIDGLTAVVDGLDLKYVSGPNWFEIGAGGGVTLSASTGGSGITFSGDFGNPDYPVDPGLVIQNGALEALNVTVNGEMKVDDVSLTVSDLALYYNNQKGQDSFEIDSGAVMLTATTGGSGVTIGASLGTQGLVIQDGKLQDLNLAVTGDITVDGTSLSVSGVAIAYSAANSDFEIASGSVGVNFNTDTTDSISGTFGGTVNGVAVPGLVIKGHTLESIDITINGTITIASVSISAQNLNFAYSTKDQTFDMSGSVSVSFDSGSSISATLQGPAVNGVATPGLVIDAGTVETVDLTLDGKADIFGLEIDFNALNFEYQSPSESSDGVANYAVSGGISVPQLFDATVTLGTQQQPGLTVEGGDWKINTFTLSLGDVPLGAFTLEELQVSFASGGNYSASVDVLFPEGWALGGSITFVHDQLSEIAIAYSAATGEGIEIGDTGMFVNYMSAELENINQPANLIVTGTLGVDFGGEVTLDGQSATIFDAVGTVTVDRNGLSLSAAFGVGCLSQAAPSLLAPPPAPTGIYGSGSGTVSINWSQGLYQASINLGIDDDIFTLTAGFTFHDLGNKQFAFDISAEADVNVPPQIPFIGGETLASIDFLMDYNSNNGSPTGFAAAWVQLDIIKKFDVGLEYNFADKSISVIGTKDVDNLQNQPPPPPVNETFTFTSTFTIDDPGATAATIEVNWGQQVQNASLAVMDKNGNTVALTVIPQLSTATSQTVRFEGSPTDPTVSLLPGSYTIVTTITALSNATIGQPTITATYHEFSPTVSIGSVTVPSEESGTATITVQSQVASGLTGQTKISLYVAPAGDPTNGTLINSSNPILNYSGATMTATWNLAGLYPIPYVVYAKIDDGFNVPTLSAPSTATIMPDPALSGIVSDPKNSNVGLAGVTVYIDRFGEGKFDPANDPSFVTGPTGYYAFYAPDVPSGSFPVSVVIPQGYQLDSTSTNPAHVVYSPGQPVDQPFNIDESASVSGTVFFDQDGSKIDDSSDPGLANMTVELKSNDPGMTDIKTVSNNLGQYVFYNVPINASYTVSVSSSPGYYVITQTSRTATIGDDIYQHVDDLDFGLLPYVSISGTVTGNSLTESGLDPSAQPLPNVAVTISQNGQTVSTTTTDSSGNYSFIGLVPGTYTISEDPGPNWKQTGPVQSSLTIPTGGFQEYNTSGRLTSLAAADFNNDGIMDFASYNVQGSLNFGFVNDDIDVFLGNGQGGFGETTGATIGPDISGNSSPILVAADVRTAGVPDLVVLSNTGAILEQNDGQAQFSANSNNWPNVPTGNFTQLAAGRGQFLSGSSQNGVAYIYANYSGVGGIEVLLPGGKDANIPITFSMADGGEAMGIAVADMNGDGIPDIVTSDAGSLYIAYGDGQGNFTLKSFPLFSSANPGGGPLAVADFNGDGRPDVAVVEGQSPYNVYILSQGGVQNWSIRTTLPTLVPSNPQEVVSLVAADFNGDGLPDLALVPENVNAGNDGPASVYFYVNDPSLLSGFRTADPSTGYAGVVPIDLIATDLNGDGLPDYVFADVNGTGSIGVVYNESTTSVRPITIAVESGGVTFANEDFTNAEVGQLNGSVYNDANRNGQQDGGEAGLGGITVYIDENGNGVYDPGIDIATTTIADGSYAFNSLPPGNYVVRIVPTANSRISAPDGESYSVAIGSTSQPGLLSFGQAADLLAPLGSYSTTAGSTVAISVPTSSTATGNALAYRLGAGSPAGASIDPSSGLFTWTPSVDQAGRTFAITVLVTDPFDTSRKDSEVFTVSVAALTPQATYVRAVYLAILGTSPDLSTTNNLAASLQSGLTPSALVDLVWDTLLHYRYQVTQTFETYLGRQPTSQTLTNEAKKLQKGLTESQLSIQLLGSAEYQRTHKTITQFVTGLFDDVLGRAPTRTELVAWVWTSLRLKNRLAIASAFVNSQKAITQFVNNVYEADLGRSPTRAEQKLWVHKIQVRRSNATKLEKLVLASDEYYNHVTGD